MDDFVSVVTTSVKSSSSIKMSRVVAVAQSKLTFVKPTQTGIGWHRVNAQFPQLWLCNHMSQH